MKRRWILASNRLPFSVDATTGKVRQGSGGLVTALTGIQTGAEKVWVGSVDAQVSMQPFAEAARQADLGFDLQPVPVESTLYERAYNGFSNDVLWPLYHYELPYVRFRHEDWQAYVQFNRLFADAILEKVRDNDLLWIHDFHLCLVPEMVKKARPSARIGHFLHIPFPSSEVFRTLPVREEVLRGLLGADLLGFQEYSDLRHFAHSLENVLGLECDLSQVRGELGRTRLGVYPVGIDTPHFQEAARSAAVATRMEELRHGRMAPWQVLGVDRLDYSKGLDLKLACFKRLLELHPEAHGQVQLLQVAIPTREQVPQYQRLKAKIERMVGEINGLYSTADWVPVKYLYTSVDFKELMALYRGSRALLVSSVRDGMNLVAQEYLAAQDPADPGTVLLSEFAGASSTLAYAQNINPWDIDGSARRLWDALRLPLDVRQKAHRSMLSFLENYTATAWAESFVRDLENECLWVQDVQRVLDPWSQDMGLEEQERQLLAQNPLTLLLDYDGTLVPLSGDPLSSHMLPSTLALLQRLARAPGVRLVVVSGRSRRFLAEEFRELPLLMAAEHGAQVLNSTEPELQSASEVTHSLWYAQTVRVMHDFARRVPNSFVENKEMAVVWHYRNSPREFGEYHARKLKADLQSNLRKHPVSILQGKKIIEVRDQEASKARFYKKMREALEWRPQELVLAFGDDATDEELFQAAGAEAWTLKVGPGDSSAIFRVDGVPACLHFLERLALLRNV